MTTFTFLSYVVLPAHLAVTSDGFDHAAVSEKTSRLYVAHTSNDTIDVIDTENDKLVDSIAGFKAVAGAFVSDEKGMVFTSNRGENTIGLLPLGKRDIEKIEVGNGPNGLAFDPKRNLLLVGNTGKNPSVSIVDLAKKKRIAEIPVPSRTRWAVFNPKNDSFYVNVKEPAQIAVISAKEPTKIRSTISLTERGPHGLEIDVSTGRLFVACDNKKLVVIDTSTEKVTETHDISGSPDVLFFNPSLKHLYVTIEDPGVVDVFDTNGMKRTEVVKTEEGAHTMAFDSKTNKVYVFLPKSHRAMVFQDSRDKKI